ncbi:MAG: hypothetical protein IPJ69_04745 [Deltaproteobacteria bacterium]|nr:MAG: hypothetical protein IPJ69_04745 [Deltaproteobacteria bacterium]
MMNKPISNEAENAIASFWDHHDATEALDLAPQNRVEAIYTPPVQSISLRLPVPLLNQIKRVAGSMDIAYQALIKVWLSEKAKELKVAT